MADNEPLNWREIMGTIALLSVLFLLFALGRVQIKGGTAEDAVVSGLAAVVLATIAVLLYAFWQRVRKTRE